MRSLTTLALVLFAVTLVGQRAATGETAAVPDTAFPVYGSLGKRPPPKETKDFVVPPLPDAYLDAQSAKALTTSGTNFDWWERARRTDRAKESALYSCQVKRQKKCKIVAADDDIALSGSDLEDFFYAKVDFIDLGSDSDRAVLGKADAPVNVMAYEAFTCESCADFHDDVFGGLKKKYIDKGLVRFAFRDFPRNEMDIKAGLLARCYPPGKFLEVVDALIKAYGDWKDDEAKLVDSAAKLGMTKEQLTSCLDDDPARTLILSSRYEGSSFFNVIVTPTFVINGYVYHGDREDDSFEEILNALVKK